MVVSIQSTAERVMMDKKSLRLGVGMADIMGENVMAESRPAPLFGWVRVENAAEIFCDAAREYFETKFNDCKVSAYAWKSGNVDLQCGEDFRVVFRVQQKCMVWSEDTLVIVNIYELVSLGGEDPLLELLGFIYFAQSRVGYLKLGVEGVQSRTVDLVRDFGFKSNKLEAGYFEISLQELMLACKI